MKRIVFSFIVVGSIIAVLMIANGLAEVKVGDTAPGFTVATTQDKPADYMRDYYGKYHLVIEFFPNAFGGG